MNSKAVQVAGERCAPGQNDWMDGLACPNCKARVQVRAEALECRQCRSRWPIIGGVPHFVDSFPYWGEICQQEMEEVNRRAESGDWRMALLTHPHASVQSAAQMILNVDRANWHWLVDLPPASRALDLGAGTGTNTHGLARRFSEVVAVEPVLERVEFMRHRFRQERLGNVKIVRSSLWVLPFAPESFDLVAMNGVLEWVAEGQEGDPERLQEAALRNALRMLRPGGYLYIGIENRVGPGYCIGYPDPHCGLPWVTVLPRPLAHWYARTKGHNGYRNYLYSARGYRNLLRRAGFSQVQVHLAIPSYNHPRLFVPLNRNIFSYYANAFTAPPTGLRGLFRNALLKAGILQYLEYSFAIVAQK